MSFFIFIAFGTRLASEAFGLAGVAWPWWVIVLFLSVVGVISWRWRPQRPFPPSLLLLTPYTIWPYLNWQIAGASLLAVALHILMQKRALHHRFMLTGLAIISLILYIATLSPDILTADNGEFQLIATRLGVAHPTGYPLYTMLAHLATWLPVPATPAYKINLFSAITSVMTLLLVYLSVINLTKAHQEKIEWVGVTTAVSLATATTFWSQATTANVRSLTALFATLTFYTLLRFYHAPTPAKRDHWLMWATLSIGSGVVHHVSLLFMGIIGGLFVLWVDWHVLHPKRLWRPLLMIPLALLPWLYLPLRAGADRAPASLATWDGFWNHVLARGFSGDFFYFISLPDLWERAKVMGNVLQFQFHPLLLLGMALGLLWLLWHERKLAFLLGGSFLLHTFITATYRAPQTVEYMLPAYIPLLLALGYGLSQWRWRTLLTSLTLVVALWQGWQLWPGYQFLHQTADTRQTTQILLEDAPPNSTILAHWHWVTPLWYLQEVEGIRPDVAVHYVAPTAEEYPATWARRVQEEINKGQNVITTHYDPQFYANLPVPNPIGQMFLFRQEPLMGLPDGFETLNITLNEQIKLVGVQWPETAVIGQTHSVTIAWQWAGTAQTAPLFAHLVGFDGQIYAQADQPVAQTEGIHLTQFRLTPRLGALAGDFSLMVGHGETRQAIGTIPITAPTTTRIVTMNPTFRYDPQNDRTLIGYDWDTTLQPARLYLHWQTAVGLITEIQGEGYNLPETIGAWGIRYPAQQLMVEQTNYVPFPNGLVWTGPHLSQTSYSASQSVLVWHMLHSSQPQLRDIATSVRLVGYAEDGFTWDWANLDERFGIPAMGGIPTLKWVGGTAVYDSHQHLIPDTAPAGQSLGVVFNLYDTFTNQPLPPLDERLQPASAWDTAIVK